MNLNMEYVLQTLDEIMSIDSWLEIAPAFPWRETGEGK